MISVAKHRDLRWQQQAGRRDVTSDTVGAADHYGQRPPQIPETFVSFMPCSNADVVALVHKGTLLV